MYNNKKELKEQIKTNESVKKCLDIRKKMKEDKEKRQKYQMKENLDTLDQIMRDVKLRNCRFIPSSGFQKHLAFIPPATANRQSIRGYDQSENGFEDANNENYISEVNGKSYEEVDDGQFYASSMGNNIK
jgi:hypothetical protein